MTITVFFDHIRNACLQTGKSLPEIASLLKESGVDGVEMDYWELKAGNFSLAKELAEAGLPILDVYCFFDWGNHPLRQDYRMVLKDLNRLGIHKMLVVPGFVKPKQDREKFRNRMLRNTKRLVELAPKYEVSVAMEDFDDVSAVFAKGIEVRWFLDRIPGLGCAFDTGNFYYSDEDVQEQFELLKDRITYVHCKDRSITPVEGEGYKATISGVAMYSAAVGSGIIPMTEVLGKIKALGYDGFYAIEHFGSKKQLEDMLASAAYLKEVLS